MRIRYKPFSPSASIPCASAAPSLSLDNQIVVKQEMRAMKRGIRVEKEIKIEMADGFYKSNKQRASYTDFDTEQYKRRYDMMML